MPPWVAVALPGAALGVVFVAAPVVLLPFPVGGCTGFQEPLSYFDQPLSVC